MSGHITNLYGRVFLDDFYIHVKKKSRISETKHLPFLACKSYTNIIGLKLNPASTFNGCQRIYISFFLLFLSLLTE
jgi:hypothetical protein